MRIAIYGAGSLGTILGAYISKAGVAIELINRNKAHVAALKEKGYNTNRLRKEKLLSEGVIQSLRENKYIALQNISKICELLDCQPADLLEYQKEE